MLVIIAEIINVKIPVKIKFILIIVIKLIIMRITVIV